MSRTSATGNIWKPGEVEGPLKVPRLSAVHCQSCVGGLGGIGATGGEVASDENQTSKQMCTDNSGKMRKRIFLNWLRIMLLWLHNNPPIDNLDVAGHPVNHSGFCIVFKIKQWCLSLLDDLDVAEHPVIRNGFCTVSEIKQWCLFLLSIIWVSLGTP